MITLYQQSFLNSSETEVRYFHNVNGYVGSGEVYITELYPGIDESHHIWVYPPKGKIRLYQEEKTSDQKQKYPNESAPKQLVINVAGTGEIDEVSIRNVADPIREKDAVNLRYLKWYINKILSGFGPGGDSDSGGDIGDSFNDNDSNVDSLSDSESFSDSNDDSDSQSMYGDNDSNSDSESESRNDDDDNDSFSESISISESDSEFDSESISISDRDSDISNISILSDDSNISNMQSFESDDMISESSDDINNPFFKINSVHLVDSNMLEFEIEILDDGVTAISGSGEIIDNGSCIEKGITFRIDNVSSEQKIYKIKSFEPISSNNVEGFKYGIYEFDVRYNVPSGDSISEHYVSKDGSYYASKIIDG